MITADDHFISISKTAGEILRERYPDRTDWQDFDLMRSCVIASLSDGSFTLPGSKELHQMIQVRLADRDMVLICVSTSGSPAGNKPFTTIVKGVTTPSDADRILCRARRNAPDIRVVVK